MLHPIFTNLRQLDDRGKGISEVQEQSNKRVQLLNKCINESNIELTNRRQILSELEWEEDCIKSSIKVWNDLLHKKKKLLHDENDKFDTMKKEYFHERASYCNSLNEFLSTTMTTAEKEMDSNEAQKKTGKLEEMNWKQNFTVDQQKIQILENRIRDLKKKIEEKKTSAERTKRERFNNELKNAIETEELRYQKLLNDRQTELKKLTYEIKLKKLRRNQELVVDMQRSSEENFTSTEGRSNRVMFPKQKFSTPKQELTANMQMMPKKKFSSAIPSLYFGSKGTNNVSWTVPVKESRPPSNRTNPGVAGENEILPKSLKRSNSTIATANETVPESQVLSNRAAGFFMGIKQSRRTPLPRMRNLFNSKRFIFATKTDSQNS